MFNSAALEYWVIGRVGGEFIVRAFRFYGNLDGTQRGVFFVGLIDLFEKLIGVGGWRGTTERFKGEGLHELGTWTDRGVCKFGRCLKLEWVLGGGGFRGWDQDVLLGFVRLL